MNQALNICAGNQDIPVSGTVATGVDKCERTAIIIMAANQPPTVYLQTQLADGEIGISPVLLQAVNQTLDLTKTSSEQGMLVCVMFLE